MLAKLQRITSWQAALIITTLGVLTYFDGLLNPFQGDDQGQIVSNLPVHSLKNISHFFSGGTFYYAGQGSHLVGAYYRPLMTTAFSVIYTLFGPQPIYFHSFQLLLCIASAILLYLVFCYSFNPLLALVLALVFLLLPLNSQIVFAIPSMQDALSFLFGILALYLLLRFRSKKSLISVVVCLFLSLLSKETGALFVALSALYLLRSEVSRLLYLAAGLIAPITLYLILKAHAVGLAITNAHIAPIDNLTLTSRLLTAPSIMLFYITKLVFPYKLATAYYWTYSKISFEHVLIPASIDILLIGLVMYMGRQVHQRADKAQYAAYIFCSIWTGLGLLSTLQLIPLDMTVSETWAYLPMAGLLGMIGVVIVTFQKYIQPKYFVSVVAIMLLLFGARTAIRGRDYSSAYMLANTNIAASKQDYVAYYQAAGDLLQMDKLNLARQYAQRSVAIFPDSINNSDLGLILSNQGNYRAALSADIRALRYGNLSPTYQNIALLSLLYGNPINERKIIIQGLQHYPGDESLWQCLAVLDQQHGDTRAAKLAIMDGAARGPVSQPLYNFIVSDQPFAFIVFDKSVKIP